MAEAAQIKLLNRPVSQETLTQLLPTSFPKRTTHTNSIFNRAKPVLPLF